MRQPRAEALFAALKSGAGGAMLDLASLAVTISRIPYGRAPEPTADSVVASWRGTCSTKHLLFRDTAPARDPAVSVQLVHRVYRVLPADARARWGSAVASTVPGGGLVDVHTYAVVERAGRGVTVDVTFPIDAWDGLSPLPLHCAEGEDVVAGDDVIGEKAALVARWCDPLAREPFIAALAAQYGEP